MRQNGSTNDQIIQDLQKQGYSSSQIFDAMNQADIKGIVEAPATQSQVPETQAEVPPPAKQQAIPNLPTEDIPEIPEQSEQQLPQLTEEGYPIQNRGTNKEEIEEVVEPIIDEKWDELMKSVDKIAAWKETTEKKIEKIEQKIQDLKSRFEELHSGILAKVGEYDKNIRNVGSGIKAMEMVFKKVLPSFTENIEELSRITKKLKTKK